jgi:hypothetical protein
MQERRVTAAWEEKMVVWMVVQMLETVEWMREGL